VKVSDYAVFVSASSPRVGG